MLRVTKVFKGYVYGCKREGMILTAVLRKFVFSEMVN